MAKLNSRTLASLVYFEACAKHLSFSDAAKELCLTTGAVSQQIRKLEENLGFKVFERLSKSIKLTAEGRELFKVTQSSLTAIEEVIKKLKGQTDNSIVKLKSTPSIVFKWLIPHLQEFSAAHPDIRVETFADAALLDVNARNFDLAIDYSTGDYSEFEVLFLMEETLQPVASPNYMSDADWHSPSIWNKISLLHDSMPWPESLRDAEWRYWLDQRGLNDVDSNSGHYFNRSDMAIAAAEAGLGVALARSALVQEELKEGRLISPYPAVKSCCNYYLLLPKEISDTSDARVLEDWLLTLAQSKSSINS